MNAQQWFEWIDQYHRKMQIIAYPIILVLIIFVTVLVLNTGGIKFGYSHSMYIPILLAGFLFGQRGGVLISLVSGLALGPYMPIDTITGELQLPENWLVRIGIFCIIGFLAGLASDSTRAYQRKLRWLLQHNNATRLPNRVALLKHLETFEDLPRQNTQEYPQDHFLLAVICCDNEIELKSAFGSEVLERVMIELAERFSTLYDDALTYQTDTAQLSVLLRVESGGVDELLKML